jgi:hypothetical protein
MAPQPAPDSEVRTRILKRYDETIKYYWRQGTSNRRRYKWMRYLTVILGASVTLISSMSSSNFVTGAWVTVFAIATPVLAALTAILAGIGQSFQWGPAWADMTITATRLQRERDRLQELPANEIDGVKEVAILDDLVNNETQNFFQRIFGAGGSPKDPPPASSK